MPTLAVPPISICLDPCAPSAVGVTILVTEPVNTDEAWTAVDSGYSRLWMNGECLHLHHKSPPPRSLDSASPLSTARTDLLPISLRSVLIPRPRLCCRARAVMQRKSWYEEISRLTARVAGRSATFSLACLVVLLWLITGPLFGYSDTWQLAINTATTIVTFLMVFLIQHTQNVDTEALQIKLDELIRATQGAHNALLDLEEMTDRQLDQFRERYEALAQAARKRLGSDEITLGTPAITLDDND